MNSKSDLITEDIQKYLVTLQDPELLAIILHLSQEHHTIYSLACLLGRSELDLQERLTTLQSAGILTRWPVFSSQLPTDVAGSLTWAYQISPSLIQEILQECSQCERDEHLPDDMRILAQVTKDQMHKHLCQHNPSLVIVGGEADGMLFPLTYHSVVVGREDPHAMGGIDAKRDIIIPGSYRGVTRISKPHAVITRVSPSWYIEDCDSSGGTYLNNQMLNPKTRYQIQDQDVIVLGCGPHAARLRAHIKEYQTSKIPVRNLYQQSSLQECKST